MKRVFLSVALAFAMLTAVAQNAQQTKDGNYVAIDLNPEHAGLCYDAFHETFAMPGYVNVVASSFSDLLCRLLDHKEDSTYWLQEGFVPLGEAFALYDIKAIG